VRVARQRARFGVIRWEAGADLEDAIRLVKACDDPAAAVQLASRACPAGERWAVVDLSTMSVVAAKFPPR